MFNKKTDIQSKTTEENKKNDSDFRVQSMPGEFYGGVNPEVEFKSVTKEIDASKFIEKKPTVVEKKEFDQKNVVGSQKKNHPANLFTSTKFLLIAGAIIFILAILVGGLYYWWQTSKNKVVTDVIKTEDNTAVVTTSSDIITTVVSTTTVSVSVSPTSSLSVDIIKFPSILLGFGLDYDGDELSDDEEIIFGTDPSIIDSDQDTYPDGIEVYYLYNPAGIEPKRLIDSDKIVEYQNPNYKYQLYYPASWTYGSIDSNYQDVLFTSLSGESVEVKIFDLINNESFSDWFARYAKEEKISSLEDFVSVFDQKGKARDDKLVYYFVESSKVYVLVYQASNTNQVNYVAIMEMMARSFRTKDNSYVKQWAQSSSPSLTTTSTVSTNTSTLNTTTTPSTTTLLQTSTSTTSTAN